MGCGVQGSRGSHKGPPHVLYLREGCRGEPWLRLPKMGQESTMERGGWRVRTYLQHALLQPKHPWIFWASVAKSVQWTGQLRKLWGLPRALLKTQCPLSDRQGRPPGSLDLQEPFPKLMRGEFGRQFFSILFPRRLLGTPVGEVEEQEEEEAAAQGEVAVASSLAGEVGQPRHPPNRRSTLPTMRGARRR